MQTTKKILLSIMVLSSTQIITTGNEVNSDAPSVSTAQQEVASVLIKQAFSLLKPNDATFASAQTAFETFAKEKKSNTILATAGKFFADEAEYCNALGGYAEVQKFPFLAALFYRHAHECFAAKGDDLSDRVRLLGVASATHVLNKLNIQPQFVQNSKELFAKKDANGKSPLDQVNDIYKLVGTGFKDRADFVKAVYEYQKSVGGNVNVVQMFGDSFVTAK